MAYIKYSYPHAFFLSIGLILLLFGFYPFYIVNLDFSLIPLPRIVIHIICLIFAISSIVWGLYLWNKREKEKSEMAKITKKRLEQSIELKELILQEKKFQNKVDVLKKEVKAGEGKIKEKESEIEESNKNILEKQKEIEEKTSKLYELRKEEVSKTPDSFFISPTAMLSGQAALRGSGGESGWWSPSGWPKTCSKCGALYTPLLGDTGTCQICVGRF